MPQQPGKPLGPAGRRRVFRRLALQKRIRAARLAKKALVLRMRSDKLSQRVNALSRTALHMQKQATKKHPPKPPSGKHPK